MRALRLLLLFLLFSCGAPRLVIEIGFDVPEEEASQIKQLRVHITGNDGTVLLDNDLLPDEPRDALVPPVELGITLDGVTPGAEIHILTEGLVGDEVKARALVTIPRVKPNDRLAIFLSPVRCGDGFVDANEACDDGDNDNGDECEADCTEPACGNTILDVGEACDDGNLDPDDGCGVDCQLDFPPSCGDGNIVLPEECDDGAQNSDTLADACRTDCRLPRCGDAVTDSGEGCDDGPANALNGACLPDCTPSGCGDSVFQPGFGEACDDGNNVDGDGCSALCAIETPVGCGDGATVFPEECDNGSANSDTAPDACRTTCLEPRCGDGVTDANETCDDGGVNSLLGPCLPDCTVARCGDGVFQPNLSEQCDDANLTNGDGCSALCAVEPPAACGDGILQTPEECDEGLQNSNTEPNACRLSCEDARCGDGIIDSGEACDDGGGNSLNGPCILDCTFARCGDGIFDASDEQCDDGNNINLDGCSALCEVEPPPNCGDLIVNANEECDNGAANSNNTPNACRLTCQNPRCGDNVIDNNEQCDDGAGNVLAGPCTPTCQFARCGDGIFQPNRGEGCDDGNSQNGDGCSGVCQPEAPPSCGDGVINSASEQCDNGVNNSNLVANACRTNCLLPQCGDGVADSGEACDNGGLNAFVGPCLPTCALAACGDGVFQPNRGEECDDGNTISGDTCDAACQFEVSFTCGNGLLDTLEECDNGPANSDTTPNACRTNCTNPRCGDGAVDAGEGCDDGGANSLLGPCLPTCQVAGCGDGIFQPNRGELCDDGNNTANDGCGPTCAFEVAAGCGDGTIQGQEQCDNGANNSNALPNACRTNCTFPRCGDAVTDSGEACDDGPLNAFAGPCVPTCQLAGCGDGILQLNRGEECDDGDNDAGDGCGPTCLAEPPANCGDGAVQVPEECDNGVNNSDTTPDACRVSCVLARCGDGVPDSSEECDNGALNNFEGPCIPTCELARCGDGILQVSRGEACDDGNNIDVDGCSSACVIEASAGCGNGFENSNEECDDGNNDDGDGCSSFCRYEPFAESEPNGLFGGADGIFFPDVLISAVSDECCSDNDIFLFALEEDSNVRIETFDATGPGSCETLEMEVDLYDEFQNFIDFDFGGGIGFCAKLEIELSAGLYFVEVFSFGPIIDQPYTLEIDATPLTCGDGLFDAGLGEECDDGNRADGDGCSGACLREFCGDGNLQAAINEECDDGDTTSGNGCDSLCRIERCGDQLVQAFSGETCDDGNATNGDGCDKNCRLEVCGNGSLQTTEQCDDGDLQAGDGCSATCTQEVVPLPYRESFDSGQSAFAVTSNTATVKWQIDPFRAKSPSRSLYMGDPTRRNFDVPGVTPVTSAFSPFFIVPATGANLSFELLKATETFSTSVDQLTIFLLDNNGNRIQTLLFINTATTNGVFQRFTASIPASLVGRTVRVELFFNAVNSFGNTFEGLYVDDFRVAPFVCGNGAVEFGETCDDGNFAPTDGCSGQCLLEVCGNGAVDFNEECDDQNTNNNDGCSSSCQTENPTPCGNGFEEDIEQCDDGNTISGDGCSGFCRYEPIAELEPNDSVAQANGPFFPDVLIRVDELNGSSTDFFSFVLPSQASMRLETFDQSSTSSCQVVNSRIDLFTSTGAFIASANEGSGLNDCARLVIELAPGTYVVRPRDFSAATAFFFEIDATFATCGNGDLQTSLGEECDDGNLLNDDGCSSACLLERCGDAAIQSSLGETCDDGNVLNNDGCSAVCTLQEASLPYLESFDDNSADQFLIRTDGSAVRWQIDTARAVSQPRSLYFGNVQTHSYENGILPVQGEALGPFFTVPANGATVVFQLFQATEGSSTFFDLLTVSVEDPSQTLVATLFSRGQTTNNSFVLTSIEIPASLAGQTLRLVLRFDSKDGFQNNFEGIYIDDLRIDPQ